MIWGCCLFGVFFSSIVTWKWTSNCSSFNTKRRCVNKLKSFQGTITRNLRYHPQSLQAVCQLPAAENAPFAISAKHTVQAWTRMPGRRVFHKQTRLWERQQSKRCYLSCKWNKPMACKQSPLWFSCQQYLQQYPLLFSLVPLSSASVIQEKEM